jgi:hypothetical protein
LDLFLFDANVLIAEDMKVAAVDNIVVVVSNSLMEMLNN